MNVFPTNYQAYLRDEQQRRAYAGGPLDFFKDAGTALNNSILGTSNAVQNLLGGGTKPPVTPPATNSTTGVSGHPNDLSKLQDKGVDVFVADSQGKLNPLVPGPTDPGRNPASNCPNCGSDWWNPGQWSCQLQKAACEGGAAASKGFGDFGQYLPYIAIGGGFLLLVILLKR